MRGDPSITMKCKNKQYKSDEAVSNRIICSEGIRVRDCVTAVKYIQVCKILRFHLQLTLLLDIYVGDATPKANLQT